jgi:uncharacterized protein
METVIFGKTGRRVSRLGFGGAPAGITNYLGEYDPKIKQDKIGTIEAIKRALQLGITYFDTAYAYGDGDSERIFGEALYGVDPKSIFLATKMISTEGKNVRTYFERSLKNLKRDRIDLLQIHSPGKDMEEELFKKDGMIEEMVKLQKDGLVKYLGFTMEDQGPLLYRLLNMEVFSVVQLAYNVIFQHPYDPYFKTGSMYLAEEKGLGITTMRSMTSGILQRFIQKANPENKFDYTPSVLQFELGNKLVDVALVGMRTVSEVERNVAIVNDVENRINPDDIHIHIVK